ncbi:hypothetical protein K501DRAFT_253032 [Backusella circina FSU 941]|nr:hypothetical protein K501DRAFT_253032 [Backusella circina FSU 941]
MFGSGAPSFGATTQSSAGTLFGAGNAQSTTPAFGSNITNSATAGTLFGGPASAAAATTTPAFGGGFGAKPTTGAFGTTNTGGLFGNTSQPPTSTAGATGFGSFGNTQQPAASTAGAGFGGFGAAPATSTATTGFGGGFGATPAATSTAGTGFGGFGAAPATSTATAGFGGFGTTPATSTASTGFGGFGATPATSTATTGFGGFGATPATSTATTGFGGFGAAPATSTATTGFGGFGTTPATSSATTGFGGFGANAAKPTLGFGGGLNTTAQTGFGSSTLFSNTTQPATQQGALGQQPAPPEKVWEDLAVLRAHWDPTSPLCHFKHYFYNKVSPGEAHLYGRPPNQDENLWNEAVRNNPDPTNYVPVLAIGFDDVWKRMELQSNLVDKHQNKLKESDDRLKQVQRQYTLDTSVKLEEYKRRHIDLSKRLLRLLRHAQVLRYKGFPLNDDEEATLEQLHQMSNQTENPAHLNMKMLGIWSQLQTLKKKVAMQESTTETWRTINDEDKAIIAKVLQDEQRGISHVVEIVKKDTAELEDIETLLKSARYNK